MFFEPLLGDSTRVARNVDYNVLLSPPLYGPAKQSRRTSLSLLLSLQCSVVPTIMPPLISHESSLWEDLPASFEQREMPSRLWVSSLTIWNIFHIVSAQ